MDIYIANISGKPVKTGAIRKTIRKIIRDHSNGSKGNVNVIFCDDRKILELNRRYRQISKPTDILSFPFNDSDLMGEIYISADTATRQAKQNGEKLQDEVHRLIVHGTVHLLGYSHDTKRERLKMKAVESRYL